MLGKILFRRIFVFSAFCLLCLSGLMWPLPLSATAGEIGIYGVPGSIDTAAKSRAGTFRDSGATAVFTRPDSQTIHYFAREQFNVYLSLNVFGGTQPWKNGPDAIPVRASGERLSGKYGGVCPTHGGWRNSRLELLERWLVDFSGPDGIDGVWLDFIRYPGRWEDTQPYLADTCYCPRCLTLFQAEKGVQLPGGLSTAESAAWIRSSARAEWLAWKTEQVVSFVRDARSLVDLYSTERQLLLGAFLVPWKKSEHKGAVSFGVAQDGWRLAPYLDVLSPMVYHKMVGKPVSWIGEMTDYFADTGVPVWPIIQAEEVGEDEFGQAIEAVNDSSAAGMLVYTFRHMSDDQGELLQGVELRENLLVNPRLEPGGEGEGVVQDEGADPRGWSRASSMNSRTFWYHKLEGRDNYAIGLTGGRDWQASWMTELQGCVAGEEYQFSADFYRGDRSDPLAYPEISVWGQDVLLNTHRIINGWQKLKVGLVCPESVAEEDSVFRFTNSYPGMTFWMRSPQLLAQQDAAPGRSGATVASSFFPIGAYGAHAKNLKEVKDTGLNSAVVAMSQANIERCLELNMRCTLSVPRSPEKLIMALDRFAPLLDRGDFSYYVNDEPGIHSFSESAATDMYDIIKQRFPDAVTNMAIVRPQAIPYYEKAADFFMLDQYPVPHMPMTWLADSMDEAAGYVGRDRLQAVIQAFGGDRYAGSGWPRLPTFAEMNCLSFLSVIHGSRGIYFYTFPSITKSEQGRADFTRLIHRLNSMRSWLLVKNDAQPVQVKMKSIYSLDPRGEAAVHCAGKEQLNTRMLICANTLGTYTEAEVGVAADRQSAWVEYYTGAPYTAINGTIFARFAPYEVKVLLESK